MDIASLKDWNWGLWDGRSVSIDLMLLWDLGTSLSVFKRWSGQRICCICVFSLTLKAIAWSSFLMAVIDISLYKILLYWLLSNFYLSRSWILLHSLNMIPTLDKWKIIIGFRLIDLIVYVRENGQFGSSVLQTGSRSGVEPFSMLAVGSVPPHSTSCQVLTCCVFICS